MLHINLANVEELVFLDKVLQRKLPELYHEFQQWNLGQQVPSLRSLGKKAVMDALNKLSKYLPVLAGHFGDEVEVSSLDYHVVRTVSTPLDCAEDELCKYEGFPNFSVDADGEQLYILFWR